MEHIISCTRVHVSDHFSVFLCSRTVRTRVIQLLGVTAPWKSHSDWHLIAASLPGN
jgi:hypothetical protein